MTCHIKYCSNSKGNRKILARSANYHKPSTEENLELCSQPIKEYTHRTGAAVVTSSSAAGRETHLGNVSRLPYKTWPMETLVGHAEVVFSSGPWHAGAPAEWNCRPSAETVDSWVRWASCWYFAH